MRVLITGGTGFIGSHLTDELRRRGHEVVACGRGDGDLVETGVAVRLLERHPPDVVVHLAARVGRVAGEEDPVETARQNAGAATLVARACAVRGVRLAYGSTSEVYGDRGDRLLDENDVYGALPDGLYGLSKRWGEEAVQLSYPDAALLRFSMPYGPGLAAGKGRGAIVTMLDQALHGLSIPAYRDIERSWCWIGDAARGAAVIIEHGEGSPWNIGRDDAHVSMVGLALLACRLARAPETLVVETDAPERQAPAHRVSSAKLQALGWEPEIDLEEGMRRTLEWLRGR
jgi:nucleoside-diphosphate-sugar epimerase